MLYNGRVVFKWRNMFKRALISIIFLLALAAPVFSADERSVVAIVKVDGDMGGAVAKALDLAGDLSAKINKWDKVIFKVSIDKPRKESKGFATNPDLVRELINIAEKKKARRLTIVEGVTGGDAFIAYDLAGYSELAKRKGAILKSLDSGTYWRSWVPDGSGYKKYWNSIEVLNCDVFVNVPVLRYDEKSSVSLSLKSMMGIVYGRAARKQLLDDDNVDEIIVDQNFIRPSDFVVIDGTSVVLQDGKTIKDLGVIIVSTDPVAADAVGAKILGFEPKTIRHLQIAESKGMGNADLKNIRIAGEKIEKIQEMLKD